MRDRRDTHENKGNVMDREMAENRNQMKRGDLRNDE